MVLPEMKCKISGETPIPDTVPKVVWSNGIDLNSVDLVNPSDPRWFEALVWPGQIERLTRLRLAANIL